jgi:hypothetical protein
MLGLLRRHDLQAGAAERRDERGPLRRAQQGVSERNVIDGTEAEVLRRGPDEVALRGGPGSANECERPARIGWAEAFEARVGAPGVVRAGRS